jgi:hypothetical protein
MSSEPIIHEYSTKMDTGSYLKISFKGEQYKGEPVLDTRVEIEEGCLCVIVWENKEAFIKEFKDLIDKYAI